MRHSDFGEYFLSKMCYKEKDSKRIMEYGIDRRRWNELIPLLHKFFLSFKEYYQIVRNLAYIKDDIRIRIVETPFFKSYILANIWESGVSFSEMWNMPYKNFFKLYLYSIGDKLMIKQEKKRDYHQ